MPAVSPRRPAARKTKQVNFRLPQDVWMQLTAAAGVLHLPQSRIVADALKVYFDAMPAAKRRVIEDAIGLRQKA
jgi:hypothetical protein